MRKLFAIVAREWRAYFLSPLAYVILTAYMFLNGLIFSRIVVFLSSPGAPRERFLSLMFTNTYFWIFTLFIVPIITMRLIAEERKTGTLELLLTSPAREIDIVLAKFAAAMTVLLAMTGLTLSYALVLGVYGNPDWGPVYSGYLGLVLLAGALAALGLAISALTANQIVAAVVSLGVFGMLWAIDAWAGLLPSPIDDWVLGLSLLARFQPFAVGAMYASDFGFFLAVTLLGLFLAVRGLARR